MAIADALRTAAENGFSIQLPRGDEIASLVVVPIWASDGELIEDAVIVPLQD